MDPSKPSTSPTTSSRSPVTSLVTLLSVLIRDGLMSKDSKTRFTMSTRWPSKAVSNVSMPSVLRSCFTCPCGCCNKSFGLANDLMYDQIVRITMPVLADCFTYSAILTSLSRRTTCIPFKLSTSSSMRPTWRVGTLRYTSGAEANVSALVPVGERLVELV
ncbi:hypothetical protein KC367_g161 [Hortaea werneckii]|nr:hypothetical protein KC367_g161 [Hortaea werneckii]